MNYRHHYHAGNFADVFKHCILVLLINALQKKTAGFTYIDTHAGLGLYDLQAEWAKKTCEYKNGIARIYETDDGPASINPYLQIVHDLNKNSLRYYPGSPLIARQLLRKQDQLIAIEMHPEDAKTLKQNFFQDPQVAVHHADGYLALKAFLPPTSHRGLVFIDPPFEAKDECDKIIAGLKNGLRRFAAGTYVIWFPIKPEQNLRDFFAALALLPAKNILLTEVSLSKLKAETDFVSCGVVLINPPWLFEQALQPVGNWLEKELALDHSSYFQLRWLRE